MTKLHAPLPSGGELHTPPPPRRGGRLTLRAPHILAVSALVAVLSPAIASAKPDRPVGQGQPAIPHVGTSASTFGKTNIGATCQDSFAANRKRGVKYNLSSRGTVSSVTIYLKPSAAAGSQLLQGIVYADSNGSPGALLARTNQMTFSHTSSAGWYTMIFAAPPTLSAGSYWLGVATGATANVAGFCYDTVNGSRAYNSNTFTSGPSNPFGQVSRDSEQMSEYATYSVTGAVPTITSFTATPAITTAGQSSTLSWTTTNVASCSAPWTSTNAPSGSQKVGPQTTTTYTLGCTGAGGSTSAATAVTVETGGGTGGSTVNPAPTGPATPAGGWHVAFADAFGAPSLVDGYHNSSTASQDATWGINGGRAGNISGFNSNELEVFNARQVSQQSDGLHERCSYTPGVASGKNYTCGVVTTGQAFSGRPGFTFTPGGGETWAIETVAKFAPQFDGGSTNGGNDEGWWASSHPWVSEIDFFEHYGWGGAPSDSAFNWVFQGNLFGQHFSAFCGCDPSAAVHRYTEVINPDNSYAAYMDGRLMGTHGPAGAIARTAMYLLLSYGLRNPAGANPIPGFVSGSRDFVVRSAAVYQDNGHAGSDITNGGIAPGTRLAASS